MKTPPFLLGAVLLFWGWQSELLIVGAVLGAILESARFFQGRWDPADEDFSRIWTFCTLLFLGAAVYSFTDNGGPENFRDFFQNPATGSAQRRASNASAQTAAALIRWTPIIFFLFVAAQAFSSRREIPLATISLILQRRWKKAKKLGKPLPPSPGVNVTYPYFVLCLLAASVHRSEDATFFYGSCLLMIWALWPHRSRRFSPLSWMAALLVVFALGYLGQRSVWQLQRYFERMNPQWLAYFMRRGSSLDPSQAKTEIGKIGRLKNSMEIVIRVEPKIGDAPTYLREASYVRYNSPIWSAGSRDDFLNLPSEADEKTWILVPDKTNHSIINIACYIPGGFALLPLPQGSGRLENLYAYLLRKNEQGAVLAEGPGLLMFDALFGPGAMVDSPPNTTNDFLVTPKEIPALETILAEIGLSETNKHEALPRLAALFQDKFTYRTWQDADRKRRGELTHLGRFLLETRAGHCEYFATATVLLLRQLGIPARYAVGYVVHERSGKNYVVRERDAHAWCIVWNEHAQRWEDFDTTPASWTEAEGKRGSLQWLLDSWSWFKFQIAKLRWGQGHLREYILLSLVPVLIALLFQILRKRRRHSPKGKTVARAIAWPGLDSEFYQIEKELAERGVERQPNEPLSDWLQRAADDSRLEKLRKPLHHLLHLHYRYRFDPLGISEDDRRELRQEARECLEKISAADRMKANR